jgi:hypothetical protein
VTFRIPLRRPIVLALVTLSAIAGTACSSEPSPRALAPVVTTRARATTSTVATTTTSTIPPTTLPPTTSPPPPPPTTAPPPRVLAQLPAHVDAYRGLGTWVDVYDWSAAFGKDGALVTPATVDAMAAAGVQTLYIQTAKWDVPDPVLEPDRLVPIIRRARDLGLRVVAWYMPGLVDPASDMAHMIASTKLGVDGIAVDIEFRRVSDTAERNRRLIDLSQSMRRALPNQSIGAIVLPPVVLDKINPNYWPGFPWHELAPFYDVWLPMAYWTNRTSSSGYRDAYRYSWENVTLVRQHLGIAGAPVHLIGGIGDETSAADIGGMLRASSEHGVLGASLYDWRTTAAERWPEMAPLRWAR